MIDWAGDRGCGHWRKSFVGTRQGFVRRRASRITIAAAGLEGQQPDCLNSFSNQVTIAQKIKKWDFEERGYFGVTKKSHKNILSEKVTKKSHKNMLFKRGTFNRAQIKAVRAWVGIAELYRVRPAAPPQQAGRSSFEQVLFY